MKETELIPGWLQRDVNRAAKRRDEMGFGKRYLDAEHPDRRVQVDNPDTFGIKQLELPPLGSPENPAIAYPKPTTRECIAGLIRSLTYRELKQIGDELKKCYPDLNSAHAVDMAQTLDDWAHMVKDEDAVHSGMDYERNHEHE